MRAIRQLRLRLRSLLRSGRVEQELDDELRYHLDRLVGDNVAAGMPPDEARDAALREMGAIEPRKEECRDARGVTLIESVRQDIGYALRTLRRSPGFASVAILSLALGIGANTAIFTLWNGVLRASLPAVDRPHELVVLSNPDRSGMWRGNWNGRTDGPRAWLTYEEFAQLRDHAASFSAVMASQSSLTPFSVRIDGGAAEEANGRLVSGGFFGVLGVRPLIGRLFTPDDDQRDAPDAVISHAYWQRRFGGRPDVLGRTLVIRDAAITIAGVGPAGFVGETSGQQPDFWLPLRLQPRVLPGTDRLHDTPPEKVMWLHVFGRLRPGVSLAQGDAEANAIFRSGLESFYGATVTEERRALLVDQRLAAQSGARGASPTRREYSQSLTALLAAVAVLLLITSANLANLLLARGMARQSEIALRLSLGASRGRVMRQLVTESVALAAIGAAAAIAVAIALHRALVQMLARADTDFHMVFTLDPAVLTFLIAASLTAALLFGVLPAWQVTRADAALRLREQGRTTTGTRGHRRAGRLLVGLQLALSLPLLVGAGLLARTVYNLQRADVGYRAERLLLARVDLRTAGDERTRVDAIRDELLGELRRIPGVGAVSYSHLGLFSGGESSTGIEVEGYVAKGEDDRESARDIVGPGYFSTLGARMLVGRELLASDREGSPSVCVVNEAFARKFFAGRHPIGLRLTIPSDNQKPQTCQVVGIAADTRTQALRDRVIPRYFVPAAQPPQASLTPTFIIRTTASGAPVSAAVRGAVERVAPSLPILSMATIEEQLAPLTAQDRTTAQLVLVFGAVALTLAAIGLYGVLAYGIARRTGEIAVRMALGARPARVIAMIVRETFGFVGAGVAVGAALAYAASRVIDNRLYGVSPHDPLTLSTATALLLAVSLIAAYVPARRASRLDPMAALRNC